MQNKSIVSQNWRFSQLIRYCGFFWKGRLLANRSCGMVWNCNL